jgi:membrane protein YqaA with SNARE-associated domain
VRRLRERRDRPRKPAGRVRTKLRAWSDRLLGLLGKPQWGVPIAFLSACLAIPPLYAVTLAVPATRMSVIPFGVAVLLGRMLLYLAIAFGVSALVD